MEGGGRAILINENDILLGKMISVNMVFVVGCDLIGSKTVDHIAEQESAYAK